MRVSELIEYLLTIPQDIEVAYSCYSEQRLIALRDISLINGCPPRYDGWVHNERPDVNPEQYLLFPGN